MPWLAAASRRRCHRPGVRAQSAQRRHARTGRGDTACVAALRHQRGLVRQSQPGRSAARDAPRSAPTGCSFMARNRRSSAPPSARPYLKAARVEPGLDLLQFAALYADAQGTAAGCLERGPWRYRAAFDWGLIPAGLPKPVILAGGLTPGQCRLAVRHGAALGGRRLQRRRSRQGHQGRGAGSPPS
jgi:hypothetical protein